MAVAVGEQRRKREAMDLLVAEITKEDDENVATSLRIAIERGWLNSFSEALNDAKKKKESEIDKICSRHYDDFLKSVNEMSVVKGSAGLLTSQVVAINKKFDSTGGKLVGVLKDLDKIQTEREKTRKLLEMTMQCKDISTLMLKTREQIESDDHYNAMRTIEQIKVEMSQITIKPLLKCLDTWLPIAINKLLYNVRSDADAFLEKNRLKIELIGNTILVRQAQISADNSSQDRISATAQRYRSKTIQRSNNNASTMSTLFNNNNSFASYDGNNNNNNEHNDSSNMIISNNKCSISLKYMRSHGAVFRLSKWAKANEFDSLVPLHFLRSPSHEGGQMIDDTLCDIGPLHKALHLYAILGNLSAYHEHYRNSREVTFNSILKQAEKAANQYGLSSAIPRYIDNIVGFFTLECVHRRCVEISDGVFSYSELAALWERACQHISTLCVNLAITLTSPDMLINIKEELLLLIDVVSDDSFGLKVAPIYEIMKNLWELFEGLQIDAIVRASNDALNNSAYQPLYVSTYDMFINQVKAYRLELIELNDEAQYSRTSQTRIKSLDRERVSMSRGNASANLDALEEEIGVTTITTNIPNLNKQISGGSIDAHSDDEDNIPILRKATSHNVNFMAQTYPFSGAVPTLIRELHVLIVRFFIFAVKNQQLGNRGEEICHSIVSAYRTICQSLSKELTKDGTETPLSKACQISIDSATLSLASESIWLMVENALKQFRWTEKLDVYVSQAVDHSISCLRSVVTQAQDLIFELLSNKIEDLLESLVFINFEPEVMPHGPHESIEEIIEFLQITFMCFTHLPQSVREAVHFTCCSRVANGILTYLLSSKVIRINVLCILAFDYDAKRLIQFSDSCGIPHLKQCFDEFHEMIRAILHPDLPQLADNIHVRDQFPNMILSKFAMLLEKMIPSSLMAASNNLPRLEKSMVKGLVKKLKQSNN